MDTANLTPAPDRVTTDRPSISAFFPAFNDAQSLPSLIPAAFDVLRTCAGDFEVIVINDGSADETGAVLERLQQQFGQQLRVITHPENRGYGGALRSGFAAASKELVFYTDGDGQYDVSELAALVNRMGPDVGLVNGYKLRRSDPLHRIWIGLVYNAFARLIFRVRLRDIDCDFRLIRKSVLDRIRLTSTSGTVCVELVKQIELSGFRVVEVGVNHYPRLHGRSQFFRVRSLLTTLRQLIGLYIRLNLLPERERRPNEDTCRES